MVGRALSAGKVLPTSKIRKKKITTNQSINKKGWGSMSLVLYDHQSGQQRFCGLFLMPFPLLPTPFLGSQRPLKISCGKGLGAHSYYSVNSLYNPPK